MVSAKWLVRAALAAVAVPVILLLWPGVTFAIQAGRPDMRSGASIAANPRRLHSVTFLTAASSSHSPSAANGTEPWDDPWFASTLGLLGVGVGAGGTSLTARGTDKRAGRRATASEVIRRLDETQSSLEKFTEMFFRWIAIEKFRRNDDKEDAAIALFSSGVTAEAYGRSIGGDVEQAMSKLRAIAGEALDSGTSESFLAQFQEQTSVTWNALSRRRSQALVALSRNEQIAITKGA